MTETKKCECGNEIYYDCTMCFECMERQLSINTHKSPHEQSGHKPRDYRHDDNLRARIDRLMIRRAKRREAQQQ